MTFGANRLLIIENSEPALYAIMEALAGKKQAAVIEGRIADIRDRDRLVRLMNEFKPDIVFHAAALKHVPILERDWSEGSKRTFSVRSTSLMRRWRRAPKPW